MRRSFYGGFFVPAVFGEYGTEEDEYHYKSCQQDQHNPPVADELSKGKGSKPHRENQHNDPQSDKCRRQNGVFGFEYPKTVPCGGEKCRAGKN